MRTGGISAKLGCIFVIVKFLDTATLYILTAKEILWSMLKSERRFVYLLFEECNIFIFQMFEI